MRQNGTTYTGPVDVDHAVDDQLPGRPRHGTQATILAYRVFGCAGSSAEDVIVAAINRAVADGADVINMSLGSVFGRPDEPSSIASNNAVDAGVVVVAAAGNAGPGAYIHDSPGSADKVIAAAAVDASRARAPGREHQHPRWRRRLKYSFI